MKLPALLLLILLPALSFSQKYAGLYDDYFEAIHQGNFKKAKKELLKISETENDTYINMLLLGHYFGNTDQIDSAKYYLGNAIDFYKYRSVSYKDPDFKKNRDSLYTLAIEVYDIIISKEPDNDANYCNRAVFKMDSGLFREALADFNLAIQIDSSDAMTFHNRGLAYSRMGLLDSAILSFDLSIHFDLNHTSSYLNKGFVYIKKDAIDSALVEFQKALDIVESMKEASYILNNMGYCYYKKADYKLSREYINESLKINPVNSYAYRNLAFVEIAVDNLKEACKNIDEAIRLGFVDQYGNEILQMQADYCLH